MRPVASEQKVQVTLELPLSKVLSGSFSRTMDDARLLPDGLVVIGDYGCHHGDEGEVVGSWEIVE